MKVCSDVILHVYPDVGKKRALLSRPTFIHTLSIFRLSWLGGFPNIYSSKQSLVTELHMPVYAGVQCNLLH